MLICAKCGMIPGRCSCDVPSPLQKLVEEQRNDTKLWFKADNITDAYFQKAIRSLHRAIEHQRLTGSD